MTNYERRHESSAYMCVWGGLVCVKAESSQGLRWNILTPFWFQTEHLVQPCDLNLMLICEYPMKLLDVNLVYNQNH